MNRKYKLLTSAIDALVVELDRGVDIFFKERPWLEEEGKMLEENKKFVDCKWERQDHNVRLDMFITQTTALLKEVTPKAVIEQEKLVY